MKRLILASLCVLLFAAGSAWADFINLPVKWSQVPWDKNGSDWLSDHRSGQVIADDFLCYTPEPIVAVRWWGSYKHDTEPRKPGRTGPFDISFHNSLGLHPGSLPGPLITMYTVNAQEVFVGLDNSGEPVYRYDAYLTNAAGALEPFDQWRYSHDQQYNMGELFIGICKPTLQNWGWHEVALPHPILDFAAAALGHNDPWDRAGCGTDMAFELMVIPEPATVCLLGLGALSLLRRRKNN
jgi:hypothetical protein